MILKKILFIILILIIVFSINYDAPPSILDEAHFSSQDGIEWLLSYPDEFNDPGVLWVLYEINKNYCDNNPTITKEITIRKIEFENHPIESAYMRLFEPNTSVIIGEDELAGRELFFDDILVPALYCDKETVSTTTFTTIEKYTKFSGYTLTHSFLALLWMKERGCLNEPSMNLLDETAERVAKEQMASRKFDDLFSERVAFLLNGNYDFLVHENWIQSIINSQESSGGWKTTHGNRAWVQNENPHTTALSVWALTQYSQKCPLK